MGPVFNSDPLGPSRMSSLDDLHQPLTVDPWDTDGIHAVDARHGVIVISNRNRGHDYDYDCELVIVIDYIHGKYNVIAIVIDYFMKVIEIMITYHDYMIFFLTFLSLSHTFFRPNYKKYFKITSTYFCAGNL